MVRAFWFAALCASWDAEVQTSVCASLALFCEAQPIERGTEHDYQVPLVVPFLRAGSSSAELQHVTSLLTSLQGLRGRPPWSRDLTTLDGPPPAAGNAVASLVRDVAAAFFFEPELRERWASEALRWATEAHSRHAACRSHQIFRCGICVRSGVRGAFADQMPDPSWQTTTTVVSHRATGEWGVHMQAFAFVCHAGPSSPH